MSVINQMLSQLEQRGEQSLPEQTMIRAVPQRDIPPRRIWMVLLVVLVLALVAAEFRRWQVRSEIRMATAEVAQVQQLEPEMPADSAPVSVNAPEVFVQPASKLSFELSAIPVDIVVHEKKKQVAISTIAKAAEKPRTEDKPKRSEVKKPVQEVKRVEPVTEQQTDAYPMKRVSPTQQADAQFRHAGVLTQQGRIAEALATYELALQIDSGHDGARKALIPLLLEQGRAPEGELVLLEGLRLKPGHTDFTMMLARLQVERGALETAVKTLEQSMAMNEGRADYHAFLAALLQRQGKHQETIEHYQAALRLMPGNGLWLMGYGLSLESLQQDAQAREAFSQALASGTLNPELQKFVQQKIK